MKIIDGNGLLLGRLAAEVAKGALLGEEYAIVNCEGIVVTGKPALVVAQEARRRLRKGYPPKSSHRSRRPELFVRRVIRGMLPRKRFRGIEALKRVRCYTAVPGEFSGKPLETIPKTQSAAQVKKTTVGEICLAVGGKYTR